MICLKCKTKTSIIIYTLIKYILTKKNNNYDILVLYEIVKKKRNGTLEIH